MVLLKEFFFCFKSIKTDKRTNLSVGMLRDLLEMKVEGPAFDDFRPGKIIKLQEDPTSCHKVESVALEVEDSLVKVLVSRGLYSFRQNIPVEVMMPPYFPYRNGIHGLRMIAMVTKIRFLYHKLLLLYI